MSSSRQATPPDAASSHPCAARASSPRRARLLASFSGWPRRRDHDRPLMRRRAPDQLRHPPQGRLGRRPPGWAARPRHTPHAPGPARDRAPSASAARPEGPDRPRAGADSRHTRPPPAHAAPPTAPAPLVHDDAEPAAILEQRHQPPGWQRRRLRLQARLVRVERELDGRPHRHAADRLQAALRRRVVAMQAGDAVLIDRDPHRGRIARREEVDHMPPKRHLARPVHPLIQVITPLGQLMPNPVEVERVPLGERQRRLFPGRPRRHALQHRIRTGQHQPGPVRARRQRTQRLHPLPHEPGRRRRPVIRQHVPRRHAEDLHAGREHGGGPRHPLQPRLRLGDVWSVSPIQRFKRGRASQRAMAASGGEVWGMRAGERINPGWGCLLRPARSDGHRDVSMMTGRFRRRGRARSAEPACNRTVRQRQCV